jgi:transcriptional regulator
MSIGTRIKDLRKEKNLTQEELAKQINTTQDSISLWEKDKRIPDTIYIIALAKFFKVTTDFILEMENEEEKGYNIKQVNQTFNFKL